jgi:transposase InsO family protein
MSLETREIAEREVERVRDKTGFPLETILQYAGISQRMWREWRERRGVGTRHDNNIPKAYYLTPEEIKAITAFCIGNPLKGYRMLRYEMIDRDAAFVSCGSVYNVIKRYNLGKKRAETAEAAKRGFDQPAAVHEQWHIDFSYIKIQNSFYYFIGILDGYSRKLLNCRLIPNMEGANAEILVAETKEMYPQAAGPRLISGNGSRFISKDFGEPLLFLELGHALTRANHTQSNGKLEPFHRALKTEHVRP